MFQALKKTSLIKLRIKSLFDDLKDNYHFIVIGLVLIGLSYISIYLISLIVIYLIYLFFNSKKLFIITLIIMCLFLGHLVLKDYFYKNAESSFIGQIISIEKYESSYKVICQSKNIKYLFYIKEQVNIGDYYYIEGKEVKEDVHYPGQFDYDRYLHYQNIQKLEEVKLTYKKKGFHLSLINYIINEYLTKHFNNPYLNTLTIGQKKDLDMTSINRLGISHLFVISGLHISILLGIVEKGLKLLKIKEKPRNVIMIIFGIGYLIVTNLLISLLRVMISMIIKIFFKKLKSFDCLMINALIMLLINPYYLFNLSFILSYLAAAFMILYKPIFQIKNKIIKYFVDLYLVTLFIQLFLLPITIQINPTINLLSFLLGPLYILFVSYFLLPLSFLTIIIYPLIYLYNPITNCFTWLTNYLSNIKICHFNIGNINIYYKLVYLVIYYYFLRGLYKKKYYRIVFLLLIFMIWYFKGVFVDNKIYFFDLEKGEATLIISKGMKEVILIDSGDVFERHDLTKILIDLGIRRIDYLIISHSDSDHIGGSFDIVKEIKVNNLITSIYENNEKIQYLKNHIKNHYLLEYHRKIKTKSTLIECFGPSKDFGNVNDNSLVFNLTFLNLQILFTGDIEKLGENELKKERIKTNLLKVAHHGSLTSSSIPFLESITYDYSIIMSGYRNTFGFPNEEIIQRLKKPFTTKANGTMEIVFKKTKVIIRTFVEKKQIILYNTSR